eukprot:scaffold555393_cov25-Prasinocladus_malaysianus.AAC.1
MLRLVAADGLRQAFERRAEHTGTSAAELEAKQVAAVDTRLGRSLDTHSRAVRWANRLQRVRDC